MIHHSDLGLVAIKALGANDLMIDNPSADHLLQAHSTEDLIGIEDFAEQKPLKGKESKNGTQGDQTYQLKDSIESDVTPLGCLQSDYEDVGSSSLDEDDFNGPTQRVTNALKDLKF
eukprot:scaffold40013_cov59-Attheya_sp.AAC.2